MTGHKLKVILDMDTVCLSVVCQETDGAWCRRGCQECEDYCVNPDEHVKPVNYCVPKEWIDLGNEMAESYAGGDPLPLHDGMAIDFDWNGDSYEWRKANQ